MADHLRVGSTTSDDIYARVLQQLQYDDFLAITTVLLASVVYLTHGLLWNRPDPYPYQLFERPQKAQVTSKDEKQSRSLATRLTQAGADIAILWASQSGTAARFAARLARDLKQRFGASVILLDISDIDPSSYGDVRGNLAILMASTYGEGDPSDNMHETWTWLQQEQAVRLEGLRFVAFGLGNSNYKHYNHVVDVLATGLEARGAQALMPIGKADDATDSTEEDFLEWKENLFGLFQSKLGYQVRPVAFEPSVEVVEDISFGPTNIHTGTPPAGSVTGNSQVHALPVIESRELFRNSPDRNCIHMELDLHDQPELKYKTGDYLYVWPSNPEVEVERLLCALGLDTKSATPLYIKPLDGTATKIPSPTTYEAMLRSYLEICAPVSREAVRSIAAFAPTKHGRDFLLRISEDKIAYAHHVTQHYTNLGVLLKTACDQPGAWKQLPMALVIEVLPRMQPRPYSISSSSVVQPRQVTITAVVADTPLLGSNQRVAGVTTNYLMRQRQRPSQEDQITPRLYASIRKSAFKLPSTSSSPIVMVGAGTGVAPFRAFVQERARLSAMSRQVGITKLYFGCRNSEQDFIYADELTQLAEQLGSSFSLTPAFSRPTDGSKKRYVQAAISEEAGEILDLLLEQNAHFYICGSAAMARDVTETISQLIMARKGWDEAHFKEFAERQKRQRRWLQDVWG